MFELLEETHPFRVASVKMFYLPLDIDDEILLMWSIRRKNKHIKWSNMNNKNKDCGLWMIFANLLQWSAKEANDGKERNCLNEWLNDQLLDKVVLAEVYMAITTCLQHYNAPKRHLSRKRHHSEGRRRIKRYTLHISFCIETITERDLLNFREIKHCRSVETRRQEVQHHIETSDTVIVAANRKIPLLCSNEYWLSENSFVAISEMFPLKKLKLTNLFKWSHIRWTGISLI